MEEGEGGSLEQFQGLLTAKKNFTWQVGLLYFPYPAIEALIPLSTNFSDGRQMGTGFRTGSLVFINITS
jgi:hypothetical protein